METETKTQTPEIIQTENKTATAVVEETPEQINWKKFREAREVERKQRDAAEKKAAEKEAEAQALKAAMDALLSKPNNQPGNQNQEEISDEEKIDRLVELKISQREQKLEQERMQREREEFPQKLVQNFNDFKQVCTSENLDYLEYHYPEVADAFKNLPDGYDKWSKVYKAVKRFVPNTESKKEQAKAEKNFNKPQAMSIPGKTQVGDSAPQNLDEKRKQDNWLRMQKVMKGG